jgi:hypothetical protein
MDYRPKPYDTTQVVLPDDIVELTEKLAHNTHEVWSQQRLADGWRWGPHRDDERKEHPCLVPFDALSDQEKAYDRATAIETIKLILALGYRIETARPERPQDGPE